MNWSGVLPAMTTPFNADMKVDHAFLAQHAAWQLGNGCSGLVMLGSLGEGATLEHDEKLAILKTAVRVAAGKPVVAAISSLSTDSRRDAGPRSRTGRLLRSDGAAALRVLLRLARDEASCLHCDRKPRSSPACSTTILWHTRPTSCPATLQNWQPSTPISTPLKESSADVRRVAAIRELLADRLQICVGVDDAIVEGISAGAVGWVAGLVNVFPAESVRLFELARRQKLKRHSNSIAGSFRCCAWIPCPSSFS